MSTVYFRFVATGADSVADALRGIRTGLRDVEREQDKTGAAAAKAGKAQSSAAQRYEQTLEKQLREVQKYGREVEKTFEREGKAAERAATKKIKEAERAAKQAAAAEKREIREVLQAREAFRRQAVGFTTGLSGGIAKGMIGIGTAAVGASLATVGAAAREDVKIHDLARRLSINSRMSGETGADPYALTREWHSTAQVVRGVKAEDIGEGMSQFVAKTGDLASARKFGDTFATVASGTGAQYSDIASSAADLMQKFDIKSVTDMQQAFATLSMQGKKGAFELRDAAAYFAEMASAAQRFGVGSGPQAIKTLGGLAQIARSATGSGAEAATAVQDMFSELVAKQKKLGAKGVDVFDAKGNTRDIKDILVDMIGHLGGADIGEKKSEIGHILGIRGTRAVSPLINEYVKAAQGVKEGGGSEANQMAAGMKAVREALDDAIEAPGTWADVVEDSAEAQKGASAQLDAIWEDLKNEVSIQVIPALLELGPKLSGVGDILSPLIDIFVSLLGAVSGFIDYLREKGVIKDRKQGVGEIEKRIELFDQAEEARKKGRSELWNPDDKTLAKDYQQSMKRVDLVRQLNDAKADQDMLKSPWHQQMGREEFAEQYKEHIGMFGRIWHGGVLGSKESTDEYLREEGRKAYDSALSDPTGTKDAAGSIWGKPIGAIGSRDATELTKRAAEYQEQVENYGGQAPDASTRELNDKLAAVAASADLVNTALKNLASGAAPRPGIFGRPGF